MTKKTLSQYEALLDYMMFGEWYKAGELIEVVGVKETRTKELLRRLVEAGLLVDNGATKGRSYKKTEKADSLTELKK